MLQRIRDLKVQFDNSTLESADQDAIALRCSREAGAPLGDAGQGFGRVDDVWAWGRAVRQSDPRRHDGSIRTVEGNSSDSVAQHSYGSDGGGAIGFVRIG